MGRYVVEKGLTTAWASFLLLGVAVVVLMTGCGGAGGAYPGGRPVTLVAPAEPGSGWDTTARAMAQVLEGDDMIDHPLPIENQSGSTGAVWLSQMVNEYEGSDDYIAVASLPIMSNKLRGQSEYDYADVTMIARIITEYYMVAVPEDSEYRDLDALIEAVVDDPQSVPVGASGDDQLPFALLVAAGGGDPQEINFISYEGGGEQITAMLNGDIAAATAGVSEFRGQLLSGDLRGLGVIRDERLFGDLEDIPTVNELGYEVELPNWRGIYGPPGMSEEAVMYWQDKLQEMLETEEWSEVAERNQWETTFMKGEELDTFLDETNESVRQGLEETGALRE